MGEKGCVSAGWFFFVVHKTELCILGVQDELDLILLGITSMT